MSNKLKMVQDMAILTMLCHLAPYSMILNDP